MFGDHEIREAIATKKLVEFRYHGHRRVVEPHLLGTHEDVKQLLGFQVGGSSKSGGLPEWRRFDVEEITGFTVLSDRFEGPRERNRFRDSDFDVIHAVVK